MIFEKEILISTWVVSTIESFHNKKMCQLKWHDPKTMPWKIEIYLESVWIIDFDLCWDPRLVILFGCPAQFISLIVSQISENIFTHYLGTKDKKDSNGDRQGDSIFARLINSKVLLYLFCISSSLSPKIKTIKTDFLVWSSWWFLYPNLNVGQVIS
jgi:hypothetical protein